MQSEIWRITSHDLKSIFVAWMVIVVFRGGTLDGASSGHSRMTIARVLATSGTERMKGLLPLTKCV